jgi:hypothetical protein
MGYAKENLQSTISDQIYTRSPTPTTKRFLHQFDRNLVLCKRVTVPCLVHPNVKSSFHLLDAPNHFLELTTRIILQTLYVWPQFYDFGVYQVLRKCFWKVGRIFDLFEKCVYDEIVLDGLSNTSVPLV